MRYALIVATLLAIVACKPSTTAPSSLSIGTTVNIGGAWSGTFASSNNSPYPISVDLSENGSNVTGSWRASTVSWTGQVTGTLDGSSFNGQLRFSGMVDDGTVCTGTASISGSASTTALSWASASGVVGGSCPAPLPVGIQIDLHR